MTADLPAPLIDAPTLRERLARGCPMRVFDCSFDLANPTAGRAQYRSGHIPGARYVHLDDDLSASAEDEAPAVSGGRHPLPAREVFARRLRAWGLKRDEAVVVYDRQGGMVCGRLWWMLRWCGHAPVAVLDGGWAAWVAAGGAVETDDTAPATAGDFALGVALVTLRRVDEVAAGLGTPGQTLIDGRAAPRYRGEVEPLDPIAGHIPGALNRPFTENFNADGGYKSPGRLRTEFEALLAGRDPSTVVHHCGSGVSAIPNLLAMAIAGLGTAPLYAGGWSQWCRTPGLPCARSS